MPGAELAKKCFSRYRRIKSVTPGVGHMSSFVLHTITTGLTNFGMTCHGDSATLLFGKRESGRERKRERNTSIMLCGLFVRVASAVAPVNPKLFISIAK